jgi:hypothetical protein
MSCLQMTKKIYLLRRQITTYRTFEVGHYKNTKERKKEEKLAVPWFYRFVTIVYFVTHSHVT